MLLADIFSEMFPKLKEFFLFQNFILNWCKAIASTIIKTSKRTFIWSWHSASADN